MNIAIFSPSQNPYSETFIQAHKNHLKGNVFYYYGSGSSIKLEGHEKLMPLQKDRLLRLYSSMFRKRVGSLWQQRILHNLKTNKIEAILVEYGTHAHDLRHLLKASKLPVIVHFHGYDASMDEVIKSCGNYKDVFEYSRFIIAVSNSMLNKLIAMGCPKDKVIYNPYGPDTSFLELEPEFLENIFIGLGRFVNKKAPYYLIFAFKKVLEKYPDTKLVIGGKGELYESCKNIVSYLRIENNVLLPGVLNREEYLAYLKKSLAFVQHSVKALNGDEEGTPVSILEASAAGLPIIATQHAGIPDVVQDGETGFLVSEHDVDAMAEKMIFLLENKDLAIKMGENGKERIKTHFTLEKHIYMLDTLIDMARL